MSIAAPSQRPMIHPHAAAGAHYPLTENDNGPSLDYPWNPPTRQYSPFVPENEMESEEESDRSDDGRRARERGSGVGGERGERGGIYPTMPPGPRPHRGGNYEEWGSSAAPAGLGAPRSALTQRGLADASQAQELLLSNSREEEHLSEQGLSDLRSEQSFQSTVIARHGPSLKHLPMTMANGDHLDVSGAPMSEAYRQVDRTSGLYGPYGNVNGGYYGAPRLVFPTKRGQFLEQLRWVRSCTGVQLPEILFHDLMLLLLARDVPTHMIIDVSELTEEEAVSSANALKSILPYIFQLQVEMMTFRNTTTVDEMTGTVTNLASKDQRLAWDRDRKGGVGGKRFQQGPLFSEIFIAHGIDVASQRVQASLLESIAFRKVMVGNQPYQLPAIFTTLAVVRDSAKLDPLLKDFFLLQVFLRQELRPTKTPLPPAPPFTVPVINEIQDAVEQVYLSLEVENYIRDLIVGMRNHAAVVTGPSPSASVAFIEIAKVAALLSGELYVTPTHVASVADAVLSSRIALNSGSSSHRSVVRHVLRHTPAPL